MMDGDGRIPVVVGRAEQVVPGDRLLTVAPSRRAGHAALCACCRPRDSLARALGSLFLEHARAAVPPFGRVVVVLDDAEAVRQAIEGDVLARARYRFAGRA